VIITLAPEAATCNVKILLLEQIEISERDKIESQEEERKDLKFNHTSFGF
jgi:hypothetical protein